MSALQEIAALLRGRDIPITEKKEEFHSGLSVVGFGG